MIDGGACKIARNRLVPNVYMLNTCDYVEIALTLYLMHTYMYLNVIINFKLVYIFLCRGCTYNILCT